MIQVKFADLVIDDIQRWRPSRRNKLAHVTLPRRHGTLTADVAFSDELQISLDGEVWKDSETALRDYFATLGAKLLNFGKDRLYLRDDGRFLYAICTGTSFPQFSADRAKDARGAGFSIEFTAGDPFWYSGTESESHQTTSTGTVSWSVTNNGGVRTPVRVHITATGQSHTDVRVNNTTTGLTMRYRGQVATNKSVVIDGEHMSVQNNGQNDINNFEGAFFLLEPGQNNLVFNTAVVVGGSQKIDVYWRERFID